MGKERYFQGTIKAAVDMNAERQADLLRKAMKGIGTDERRIIQILASHNNDQRQEIANTYKQSFGRDLIKDLKSELCGCFEDAVVALMTLPDQYDAMNVHKAIKGLGTDESLLIEVLCPRTNQSMTEIKEAFKTLYGKDMMKEVESDISGDFKRVLVAQLQGNRTEEDEVDMEKVKKDAQDIYDAGEGRLGTDESLFNKVLCMRSFPHLRCMFEEYKRVASKDLKDSIKSETSGNLKESFLAIVKWTENRPAYIAERLHKTMAGIGTDDEQLIRLIVSHSETSLADVKEEYFKMYGKSLRSMIEGDTSGDYKKLLCAIVDGTMTPP
ncbi:annexin-B12-like [Watersipora subatra]|uniref:annexin-B12-like n=1 Tax=Watersipora subatra TaxID=2589382 RepID=UPI00355C72FD